MINSGYRYFSLAKGNPDPNPDPNQDLGQFPYKSFLKPIFPVGLVKTYYEK
jgi:hypothetical protein